MSAKNQLTHRHFRFVFRALFLNFIYSRMYFIFIENIFHSFECFLLSRSSFSDVSLSQMLCANAHIILNEFVNWTTRILTFFFRSKQMESIFSLQHYHHTAINFQMGNGYRVALILLALPIQDFYHIFNF